MGAGGLPPVAQPFAPLSSSLSVPSSSSQFSSAALHTGGQSRTGYTREDSLRGSASLQDFSSFGNGPPSNGLFRSVSLAGGFGSTLPSQQAPRNDGGVSSLTSIKSNILKRSSGSMAIAFQNNAVCTRQRIILALVALLGTLLFLGVLWGRSNGIQDQLEYAVIIDCGSTGTRIHVYGWTYGSISGKESLPVMLKPAPGSRIEAQRSDGAPTFDKGQKQGDNRLYNRMETEPGLDKLLHNESGVTSAIVPLISWATKQIPEAAQRRTKLFFLATAGLRRLSLVDSRWLLDKAWYPLVRSPFMCRREWVRVISGQEEAYYGWIALNYNLNRLGHHSYQPTLGALDLGGSSLEVTFEPAEEIPKAEYLVNVSVGAQEHHLYAHSHSGFGLNDAFEKSVALLIESSEGFGTEGGKDYHRISHPCLNSGYKQPFLCSSHCLLPPIAYAHVPHKGRRAVLAERDSGPKVELVGKPNWERCQSLVLSVINMTGFSQTSERNDCEQSPCALGKYQPQPQGHFFALAGFFVVFKFFGLTSANTLDDLLLKGQEFCNLNWKEAQQSVVSQPSIDRYCFRAPYMAALLRQGLHLSDEQVDIGSGDFAWTLGAALKEAGALLPANLRGGQGRSAFSRLTQSGFPLDVHLLTFLFVLIFLAILVLIVFGQWITCHPWHRPYLPLFVSQNARPFSWFPRLFRSQLRPGANSGAEAGQPGDGWVKQPHSPAPSGFRSFNHQMFEPGDMHAGGDGPVLECDVLQDPSGAVTTSLGGRSQIQLDTVKMQQKGRSQLQSRRSQSREDLNSYVSPDNPHISKVKPMRQLSPVRMFTPLHSI